MAVDTAAIATRRELHFNSIDDILADVEHLNQGKIKTLGNWSGGQILKHLAIVMNGSIDGLSMEVPWWLRLLAPWFKGRFLAKGMKPGIELKGSTAEALVPPATSWEEGLDLFRKATNRLKTESKRERSPIFGAMTKEDWDKLHCRHAELHLGFLVPDNG
jgi:hypothetical protein